MKGDFTRDTFNKKNLFSRVLMQQGRVTLDADYNEQVEILLHYMRTLARDLIGPYGGPAESPGFRITTEGNDNFWISAGRYYVDGILVENDAPVLYSSQPNYKLPADDYFLKVKDNPEQPFWVYLDVWERHVTSIDHDAIREKALGGPDTCTRTKVVWQVKAIPVDIDELGGGGQQPYGYPQGLPYAIPQGYRYPYGYPYGKDEVPCDEPLKDLVDISQVRLAARVDPGKKIEDACATPPDSKYRGVENHLYRVEIHKGGTADEATFKWARDNGSIVTAWLGTQGNDLEVANARGFSAGSWVELSDDGNELWGNPGTLVKVTRVEGGMLSIDPASVPAGGLQQPSTLVNPKVRRWDQVETGDIQLENGAVPVTETLATEDEAKAKWIDLEDGIQIAFTQIKFASGGTYRTGDYWLIPARVATGDIEWPEAGEAGKLSLLEPNGIVHHYAPLGYLMFKDNKLEMKRCYCTFEPNSDCFGTFKKTFGGHLLNYEIALQKPFDEVRKSVPVDESTNRAMESAPATIMAPPVTAAPVEETPGSSRKRGRRAPAKGRQQ